MEPMFTAERTLVNTFKKSAKDFIGHLSGKPKSQYFLMEEFDSYHGVADLVLGTYRKSRCLQTDKLRKSINWDWIRPLLNLKNGNTINVENFISIYNVSPKTAKLRLQEYFDAGFLQLIEQDQFKVIRRYQPVTETIISIEAKLRNWKKALQQAYRYKRFSHYSFVLLDEGHLQPALKQIDLFKNLEIGLISMTPEGYTIHFSPRKKYISQTHSYLRLNEAAFDYFKVEWANA